MRLKRSLICENCATEKSPTRIEQSHLTTTGHWSWPNTMVSNINIDDWCPRPFIADIPTLHPKEEELRDFNRFMQNAIVDLRSSCGLIKVWSSESYPLLTIAILQIIPPKNWTKDLSKIENFNLSFQTTRQKRNGKDGIFSLHQSNDQKLDFHDFKQFALDFDSKHARVSSAQIFERKFWKKIHSIVPVQAVESNSLFNSNIKTFNLNNLKTILGEWNLWNT